MSRKWLAVVACIVVGTIGSANAWTRPTVNGHAVSVAWRNTQDWTTGDGAYRGSIVKFTIQSGSVHACDTIYRRSNGFAQYPTLSPNGQQVAFYRWGEYMTNNTLQGRGAPSHIAVMDINGQNLRNLAVLPALLQEEPVLDWPLGDWIYYKMPRAVGLSVPGVSPGRGRETAEIWRVSIRDASLNQLVVKFIGWVDTSEAWIRRFSLSLDGRIAEGQYACQAGYGNQNLWYSFPPLGGYIGNGLIPWGTQPGCNGSVSASGKFSGYYFAGEHEQVNLAQWDPLKGQVDAPKNGPWIADLSEWLGRNRNNWQTEVGRGANLIRWAVNSDKWVLQQIGWYGQSIDLGCNQILANWVDQQAIETSNNPKVAQVDGNVLLGNCVGDFWVDGGPNAAGKYEDIRGNWVAVGSPVGYYTSIDATEGNPSTVTVVTSPANAEIRYSTDGSEPTTSSGKYIGPLSLNVDQGRPMVLKTLSRADGSDSSRSSKTILPSCKPLPAGYIKELLCLENATGKQGVPSSDTSAVYARYVGTCKPGPFEGEQITVNGRTYTWHLRQDPDGIFEPAGPFPDGYWAFWFTYLVSPQVQTVKLGAHFTGGPQWFCNGRLVGFFDGHSGDYEFNCAGYPFGFGLDKGVNGILTRTSAGGSGARLGMRVVTPGTDLGNPQLVTGVDITNLKYYPYSGSVVSATEPKMQTTRPSVSLSLSGSALQVRVMTPAACALIVCNARGEIVASRRAQQQGSWRVEGLTPGWYVLNMVSNDTSRKLPFVLQRQGAL